MDLAISITSASGGFIFVGSLALQLYKIIKTGSSDDLSFGWLILMTLAIGAGLLYGIYFDLWPIWTANSFQLLISLCILIVKIIHKSRSTYVFKGVVASV